jgi:mannose-6-phosphate isomerase-like protein (cupin superfamily)
MKGVKDSSGLYEVERRAYHAARPGFRIAELQISPTQKVPWHYHNNVHDTFYVVTGAIRVFHQDPKEEVRLTPGQTYSVPPKRPHRLANAAAEIAVSPLFFRTNKRREQGFTSSKPLFSMTEKPA